MQDTKKGIFKLILTTLMAIGILLTFLAIPVLFEPIALSSVPSYMTVSIAVIYLILNIYTFVKTTIMKGEERNALNKFNNLTMLIMLAMAGISFMHIFVNYPTTKYVSVPSEIVAGVVFGIFSIVALLATITNLSYNWDDSNHTMYGVEQITHSIMMISLVATMILMASTSTAQLDILVKSVTDPKLDIITVAQINEQITSFRMILTSGIFVSFTCIVMSLSVLVDGIRQFIPGK